MVNDFPSQCLTTHNQTILFSNLSSMTKYLLVIDSVNVFAVTFVLLSDDNQSVMTTAKTKPPMRRPKQKH